MNNLSLLSYEVSKAPVFLYFVDTVHQICQRFNKSNINWVSKSMDLKIPDMSVSLWKTTADMLAQSHRYLKQFQISCIHFHFHFHYTENFKKICYLIAKNSRNQSFLEIWHLMSYWEISVLEKYFMGLVFPLYQNHGSEILRGYVYALKNNFQFDI